MVFKVFTNRDEYRKIYTSDTQHFVCNANPKLVFYPRACKISGHAVRDNYRIMFHADT